MSTDVRPVPIPVQKFLILNWRGVSIGVIDGTVSGVALVEAQRLYGSDVYLVRAA